MINFSYKLFLALKTTLGQKRPKLWRWKLPFSIVMWCIFSVYSCKFNLLQFSRSSKDSFQKWRPMGTLRPPLRSLDTWLVELQLFQRSRKFVKNFYWGNPWELLDIIPRWKLTLILSIILQVSFPRRNLVCRWIKGKKSFWVLGLNFFECQMLLN